jgi:ABC-type glycerol-3-phosphate transport system permease component
MVLADSRRPRWRQRWRGGRGTDLLFILPTIVILTVFLVYPLVYGIVLSVHDTKGFALTSFIGLEHYARAILGDAVFHESLAHTLLFTGTAVVLQTGLGLLLALLLADVDRGRAFFVGVFFLPFVIAPVAVGAVWKFLLAPFFGIVPTVGAALGLGTATFAPLADADVALWAIMAAFLWRFAGFSMVVYLAAIRALPREYDESAILEGAGRFERFRRITWPLLWPQTFALVLLTTLGTLRIFDMVWVMTDRVPLPRGRLCAGDGDDPARRDRVAHGHRVSDPRPTGGDGERVRLPRVRWSAVLLSGLAVVWLYPVAWTFANAIRASADIYRAPWDIPWPPAIGNVGEAWDRGQLGLALANSAYVTALTVALVLGLAVMGAYALTRLRPPARALLFLVVLAPLIVPTEVLIVPLFSMYRALGLINSLSGLALTNVVASVSFSTIILAGYFRTIPQDVIDAARVDGAGRVAVLLRIVMPIAHPGIVVVGALVAVFTWNDFAGALVLLQRPESFTIQLALTRFSTFNATDQGLTFAGMAIAILPPVLLFLVLRGSFIRGLTTGTGRQ